MIYEFDYIFNGTQKEMEEFINKCDNYIDIPIAKWGDFKVVYNKLDGIFQVEDIKGYMDICPYFLPEGVDKPLFQQTLNDIIATLEDIGAEKDFIVDLYELLEGCDLDTYEDINEDELDKINKMRNEYEFKIDTNKYKMYMKQKDNKINENNILGFDPAQLKVLQQNETDAFDETDYYDSVDEMMKEAHIEHCYKDKDIYMSNSTRYIYLAGKIEKNGWREDIVGYRCGDMYGGDYTKEKLTKHCIKYKNGIIITGPWFLACDHGCYHGDNTHGLGINVPGDPEANGDDYSEEEVYNICLDQIKRSDIIFAYINDESCYGSIYEIAWAKAHGKKIILIFDNENLMSDMWFMCQGAHIVDVLGNKTIKEKFDEICYRIRYKIYNYL